MLFSILLMENLSHRRYTTALAIGEGLSGSIAGVLGMLQSLGPSGKSMENRFVGDFTWKNDDIIYSIYIYIIILYTYIKLYKHTYII